MGDTAVVIGSGIGGLAAAAALVRRFERVVVLERDPAPDGDEARPGVPQGPQFHVLLEAGARALEGLLPGLRAAQQAAAGDPVDFGPDLAWRHFGHWKTRVPTGFLSYPLPRPHLERLVRERVATLPAVELRYRARAVGLTVEAGAVTGVQIEGPDGPATVPAALVVDASGRSSRLPEWLPALGGAAPPEDRVTLGLKYTTGVYAVPAADDRDFRAILVSPRGPDQPRGAAIQRLADGTWFGGAWGYHGDHPPGDFAGLVAFLRALPTDGPARLLADATPLGPLRVHGFPYMRWARYDRGGTLPRGLLPLGDVVASIDPVYGQGMTCAALQAAALPELLGEDAPIDAALTRAWVRRVAAIVRTPWEMAAGEAFRFREAEGARPAGLGLLHPFVERVAALGATDVEAYRAFLRVMHLLDAPTALFRPAILGKLLASGFALPADAPGAVPRSGG